MYHHNQQQLNLNSDFLSFVSPRSEWQRDREMPDSGLVSQHSDTNLSGSTALSMINNRLNLNNDNDSSSISSTTKRTLSGQSTNENPRVAVRSQSHGPTISRLSAATRDESVYKNFSRDELIDLVRSLNNEIYALQRQLGESKNALCSFIISKFSIY